MIVEVQNNAAIPVLLGVRVVFWDSAAQNSVNGYSVNDTDGKLEVCIRAIGTTAKEISLTITAWNGTAIG